VTIWMSHDGFIADRVLFTKDNTFDPTNLDPQPSESPRMASRPTLVITAAGNQATLSWAGTGFVLQENTNVADPGGWMNVPNGGTSPVAVQITGTNTFFRLLKQ